MNKIKFPILRVMAASLLMAGCASFNANTYNAENLMADAGHTAIHEFNQYYQSATNGATAAQIEQLNGTRDEIYTADRDLSKGLVILDKARLDYVANSADTNKTAMAAAMQTVSQESSNLVSLVKTFIGTPKPATVAPVQIEAPMPTSAPQN